MHPSKSPVSKMNRIVLAAGFAASFPACLLVALLAPLGAQAPTALPKDVYPDSRFRLPLPKRDELDDYGKKVYDRLADPGRKSLVGLQGPAGIRLASPRVAEILEDANTY